MKAKTKFMKMFHNIPEKGRREWVLNYFQNPLSMNVVAIEVKNNTNVGKQILKQLGYENDKKLEKHNYENQETDSRGV